MTNTPTVLTIENVAEARTPAWFGVNVEIQEHTDTGNLWDWLQDSGAGLIRQFHPDRDFRKIPAQPGMWGTVSGKTEYEALRRAFRESPLHSPVRLQEFSFNEPLPYLGIPDRIVERIHSIGIANCISIGYRPKMFPRPLLKIDAAAHVDIPAADTSLDWEAMAAAYDYHAAIIYHYAEQFGAWLFLGCNEPEWSLGGYYLSESIRDSAGMYSSQDAALRTSIISQITVQLELILRVARHAFEDVRSILTNRETASRMRLSGCTSAMPGPFWKHCNKHLDILDFHHYNPEARNHGTRFRGIAPAVNAAGKAIAVGEFGRKGGGRPMSDFPFQIERSLENAAILMEYLSAGKTDDPEFTYATFYIFAAPSTHRNYKHLVYGDMNLLDWSGHDIPLWNRGVEWKPTAGELQLRFATPAYACYRMLARCCGRGERFEVLRSGIDNRESPMHSSMRFFERCCVIRKPGKLVITMLNSSADRIESQGIDLSFLTSKYTDYCIRVTDKNRRDVCISIGKVEDSFVQLDIPAQSLVQVVFYETINFNILSDLRCIEDSSTPGNCADLKLLQTTRLRALACGPDGEIDITEDGIVFTSSHPELVRIDGCGLVQRMRSTTSDVTLTLATADKRLTTSITVPPDRRELL